MKRKKTIFALVLLLTSFGAAESCKKTNSTDDGGTDPTADVLNLPTQPFNYANPALPPYLRAANILGQVNTPPGNAVTDNGATLGRVLFYDKSLSANNTVSCASCHKQETGFADNAVLSRGFAGELTGRNSMTLVNAQYYPNGKFFWDERAATLEDQVLQPIQDHKEMGLTLAELVARVQSKSYYPVLFQKAFGDVAVNSNRIALSLSQFVRSMVSFQAKFDVGRQALQPGQNPGITPYANFTAAENRGKELFFSTAGCAACHGTETFTAPDAKNNGLDAVTTDKGVGGVTNLQQDMGKFKIGTLRDIALTAPYMHDGRFTTLEEVVEHYNSGVKAHPNLAPQLRGPGGQPKLLNLNAADKAALVAFMKTLTDASIGTDVKFSNPFK